MLQRIITGIVLALAFFAMLWLGGYVLYIGLLLVLILGIYEMFAAIRHAGLRPVIWPAYVYGALLIPALRVYGIGILPPMMLCCMLLAALCVMFRKEPKLPDLFASLIPPLYPGISMALLLRLTMLSPHTLGIFALGACCVIAFAGDTAAYFVGVTMGRRKLAPLISPNKTVEGAVGGLLGSMLAAVVCGLVGPYFGVNIPIWAWLITGLFGGVAEQAGDLIASMLKRFCGVKDFGSIFPGHGGVLDRIDGVLFSALIVYILFMVRLSL